MVLVGIFTKLGLEKAQGPPTEMTVSRTLTDLLKQPGHGPSEHIDGLMGSVQVQLGEGLARGSPRSSADKLPLNNAVASAGVPPLGRPHSHGKRLPPTAPSYSTYATLTAGGEWGQGAGAWREGGSTQEPPQTHCIPLSVPSVPPEGVSP
ncbi:SHSA8 protein, partial [Asarcornis scutulata]|nr:SHSA8 protein [Asarcornis scutulata]